MTDDVFLHSTMYTMYTVYASEWHILYHTVEKRAWSRVGRIENETTRLFVLEIYHSTMGSMILIHTKRPVLGSAYPINQARLFGAK